MENHIAMLGGFEAGAVEAARDTIDWLQGALPDGGLNARPTTATQGMKQNPSQHGNLPPTVSQHTTGRLAQEQHIQQQQTLQALQTQALVNSAEGFGWPEFSPRSINLPGSTHPAVAGHAAASMAAVKQLQQQTSQMQAALDLAAGQAQTGFTGLDYRHSPFLFPHSTAPGQVGVTPTGPPATDVTTGLPTGAPFQLPPLPAKGKRGRGAPKKNAKYAATTVGSRGIAKKGDTTNGRKSSAATAPMTAEEKRRIRAERNRESAEKSRLRRKKYTDDLEKEVDSLRETNKTLKTRSLDLMTMLHGVDNDVDRVIANGEGRMSDAPNGGAALKAAILALENVKQQCPMTFGPPSTRVPNVRSRNPTVRGPSKAGAGDSRDTPSTLSDQ